MTARQHRSVTAFGLAVLLCGVAPAAMAQVIPTANNPATGISAEQALALSARLDALEKRNDELEAVIQDLAGRVRREIAGLAKLLHGLLLRGGVFVEGLAEVAVAPKAFLIGPGEGSGQHPSDSTERGYDGYRASTTEWHDNVLMIRRTRPCRIRTCGTSG